MEIEKLRQNLHKQKNRIGLVGGTIKIEEYDEAEHNVAAHISPQNWNIQVSIKKGYNPIQDRRQQAYAKKKKIQDGLETLVIDVTSHEFTHWQLPNNSGMGCPYDIYNHDKILEAIKEALPSDQKGHSKYVANAFEDMICNPRVREWKGDFSGQVLFWDGEGLACKEQGQDSFTPFYEAFVKLNMHLWGDNADKSLLKRHYSNSKEVNKGVSGVISELNLPANIKSTSALFDKQRWPEMARIFAKNLAHLLEQSPTERLSAFSGESGGSEGDKEQSGNGVEERSGTKDGKEEIAYGRYSSGEKQSSNLTSYDQLDSLYRRLAKPLIVRVEAMSKEMGLTIAPLTTRPFDEEKDDPAKLKLSKLFVTEDGLKLAYPSTPLTITSRSKFQRRSFPDFKMVVLDNSGSMRQALDGSDNIGNTSFIPWGDKSKYHFALLGFYGIENFLQQQGIAQYIEHGLSAFSSTTRFKQAGFSGIDEVRKLALAPEFGNTNIDATTLEQALAGRESFVLSLSDGEVGNWEQQKATFVDLAKKTHYAHIQIGSPTKFSKDLESLEIPVFPVNSGDDLSKLMVNITKKTYEHYTKQ
jgi:hypothetical protein